MDKALFLKQVSFRTRLILFYLLAYTTKVALWVGTVTIFTIWIEHCLATFGGLEYERNPIGMSVAMTFFLIGILTASGYYILDQKTYIGGFIHRMFSKLLFHAKA